MSETKTTTGKVEIECPKCYGKKTIDGCSHIENGVCFTCSGNGAILVTPSKAEEMGPSELDTKCAEWVMNCTQEQLDNLTFRQISKARSFCHGGDGLQQHFPTLLETWREKCEATFKMMQDEKLEEYRVNNPV